jgi:putative membrane protein
MEKRRAYLAAAAAVMIGACAFASGAPGANTAYSGADPVPPEQKHETVYADTGADGKVNAIVVSVHLVAPESAKRLSDRSDLDGILSITRGANPVIDGETVLWQADGEDVYYQGASLKALPVGCSFTYTLDGEPIGPGALAGKSGRVTITGKYENFDRHMERINGSLEEIFTPFTLMTAVELPSAVFTDVAVDNGRLIDQGDSVMAIGFGLPGLAGSLNIGDDGQGIPDGFTLTATAKDFALDSMTTLAVPGILTAEDIGKPEFFDSLQSGLYDLDGGGREIRTAADEFSSGMAEFNGSFSRYVEGLGDAESGAAGLLDAIERSGSGSGELHAGAQALADALKEAADSTGGLDDASGQIDSLGGLSESLSSLSELLAGLEPLSAALAAMTPAELAALGIDPAAIAALHSATSARTDLSASAEGLTALAAQLQATQDRLAPLIDALTVLSEDSQALADGIGGLFDGLADMEKGAARLNSALKRLFENGSKLGDGANSLADHAAELAAGMERYSRGVHEFSAGVNGSIDGFNARRDAVLALGEAYDNFSLLPEGCSGSVRFVFTTEPVKAF